MVSIPGWAQATAFNVVEPFGADPYGLKDVSGAFESAFQSMPKRGATLIIPPGIYRFDHGITPPDWCEIVGSGTGATILYGSASCTDSIIQRHGGTTRPASATAPATGIRIRNLTIDGSQMPLSQPWGGGKGTFFQYLRDCHHENVVILNTPASCFGNDYHQRCTYRACHAVAAGRGMPTGQGSYPGGNGFGFGTGGFDDESFFCYDCWAESCFYGGYVAEAVNNAALSKYMEFHNSRASGNQFGFRFEGPGTAATGTGWAKLIGCSAVSNTKDGIGVAAGSPHIIIANAISRLNGQDGIYVDNPASVGIDIHDCTVDTNTRHGIHATSGKTRIHDNEVFNNGQHGILSDSYNGGGNILIHDNEVYNNGQAASAGAQDGIRVTPNAGGAAVTDILVHHNRCYDDQGSKTQRYGFITTGAPDHLRITDNDLQGNLTGAYLNTATGTHQLVRGNLGVNPVGPLTPPAVPATTVVLTNPFAYDCTVHIAGGTVTVVAIGGTATGLTSGAFRVPAGQTITLTYSVAPTWTWFGD